jgi:hypothetical protein
MFPTRDAGALVDPADDDVSIELMLERHASKIVKLDDKRIEFPREEPYYEGHNTWCVNVPGSLLAFPVGDLAQHAIAAIMFLTQNGYCLGDDVNGRPIPDMEKFRGLVDVDDTFPLTFFDQYMLAEITAELATSCYAGMLVLQAMGLGGWMFDGIDRFSMLGASGDPDIPGLGFRYDEDERWSVPNPTGREGVFEAYCPPHYPDMYAAVEALCERKFGKGGPHNANTLGAWTESALVRSSAQMHDERFRECVSIQAQYIFDTFGKFPATVPSLMILNYLQAHHLDLDFYDQKLRPGSYLETHAQHMETWH